MYLFPKKNRESIYVGGKKLNLGDVMPFTIVKKISVGEDEYYIFKSSSGTNYMVPSIYYNEYNFNIGQEIKGWVDKINCTGRIFIEPFHPHYNVGEVYSFDVVKILKPDDKIMTKDVLIVMDILNSEWEVEAAGKIKTMPQKVSCRVDIIKKGQLYLSLHK
ncbi:MAG: hypothetical protein HY958_14380 [Bacteroidia bacterium]|nr:hypothetical protein [Bacteroidia bacterium]